MFKTCKYCGRIHDVKHICLSKPQKKNYKANTLIDRFRSSKTWIHKRNHIKDRDKHLCQICIRKLYNTFGHQYNYINIQVHHIVPIAENWDRRLDDDNLISLCSYHHGMAEKCKIPREELIEIVIHQNNDYNVI